MNNTITCENHGEANETFVCEHLVGASSVNWYSAAPTKNDLWPSAWCKKCHQSFITEGEWNEKQKIPQTLQQSYFVTTVMKKPKTNVKLI